METGRDPSSLRDNNMFSNKKNDINETIERSGSKRIIPELLSNRLESRKNARVYWLISVLFNIFMPILSGYFFDCYYYTKDYITDGDYFWQYYKDHNLSNKAVPLSSMLTGMICILTFVFNLMNYIVIGLYIIFGGVRDRIVFASKL